jgi:hypothetical protein
MSMQQLGQLKEDVEKLVDFFQAMLVEIETTVTQHLEGFLDPIKRGARDGELPGEISAIEIREGSKRVRYAIFYSGLN